MDSALKQHLALFFSPRALAYFERGGAVRHANRHADRETLRATLERLGLPHHESAFLIEERYGGIEIDDDYQWLIGAYDPIAEATAASWRARSFGDQPLVLVAACATSNVFVDANGRIYEDVWELGLFVHSADSLEARLERDAIFNDMALVMRHGGREAIDGHHGKAIAEALTLTRLDEASDSRETWWQGPNVTVADTIKLDSAVPQTLIFGRDEAAKSTALAICG